MKLSLELESDRVAPGERAAGQVRVLEGGPSRALTLTLTFHEWTRDFDVIADSSGSTLYEGDLVSGQALEFSFTLPVEAPTSAKCEHSELFWELDVTSNEPGLDTHARRRIAVG